MTADGPGDAPAAGRTVRPDPGLLWPAPRRVDTTGTWLAAGARVEIVSVDPGIARSAAEKLSSALGRLGVQGDGGGAPGARLTLAIEPGGPPQGYRLRLGGDGGEIVGADAAGLFYGACTLAQWLELHRSAETGGVERIAGIEIRDWPDFPVRGVMLDVSRNKVPTMDTLFELADQLAGWKINQLQLYMEHTFAYSGHEAVWRGASPLTGAEIEDLDRFCAERFIELVPNQNSFGHFHRWLTHPAYRPLAECPDGVEHPFSNEIEPFSLCPTDPRALDLLADLYDQLLPHFSSRLFNVGLDETFDLGRGRSAAACAELGGKEVYLRFLREVHRLVGDRGRKMLFWSDVVLERPELADRLPADAIALDWGYEADHPFAEETARLAASGLEYWVCPGTSSWNSFAGRSENALLNLSRAALAGLESGAGGYLITDWGDFGHLQPLSVSYLGLLAGAGFSWSVDSARRPLERDFAELLDRHAFGRGGVPLGRVAVDLGNLYLASGEAVRNGTALFFLLMRGGPGAGDPRLEPLRADRLRETLDRLEAAAGPLAGAPAAVAASGAAAELAFVADLLRFACRYALARLGAEPIDGDLSRAALVATLERLIGRLREIWLARNRPGGLDDSAARLARLGDLIP